MRLLKKNFWREKGFWTKNNTMLKAIVIAIIFFMSACTQKSHTAADLLKDNDLMDSIMSIISSDDQLREKMLTHLITNRKSDQMMQNIISIADKDSSLYNLMIKMMIANPNTNKMLINSLLNENDTMMMYKRDKRQTEKLKDTIDHFGF